MPDLHEGHFPPEKMAEMKDKPANLKTPATIAYPTSTSNERRPTDPNRAGGEQTVNLELKD